MVEQEKRVELLTRVGVSLQSMRLVGQLSYSVALAEADEPELAAVGWGVFQTEVLRRQTHRLTQLAQDEPHQLLDHDVVVRVYDIHRRCLDLIDTIECYARLAAGVGQRSWLFEVGGEGLWELPHLLHRLGRVELQTTRFLKVLVSEGMRPGLVDLIRAERSALVWAVERQDEITRQLVENCPEGILLKGQLFLNLLRLNQLGRMAYRGDSGHRGRFNLEILDGYQPGLVGTSPSDRGLDHPPLRVAGGFPRE